MFRIRKYVLLLDPSMLAVIILLLLIITPIASLTSTTINLDQILLTPNFSHLLGTDNLGRDLLWRLQLVLVNSVIPLWSSIILSYIVGIILQVILLNIKYTNWVVRESIEIVEKIFVFFMAVPLGVLIFTLAAIYEYNSIEQLIVVFSIVFFLKSYLNLGKLFYRDHLLSYWQAHKSMGGTLYDRIFKYGIFDAWKLDIVRELIFALKISLCIEIGLSYLGYGVQEPNASFGNIFSSHLETYLNGDFYVFSVLMFFLIIVFQATNLLSGLALFKMKR